jgi:hypothetical protein
MLSSLALATIVCFLIGIAVVVALKGAGGRTDGTIARVLYNAEHPEKRR